MKFKQQLLSWYEKNEKWADISFFLGGFLFDIITLSEIDDVFSLGQQFVYLLLTGGIIYYEFLIKNTIRILPGWLENYWDYRRPLFHFLLGSLLSIYSLFFLMSSSLFSSLLFVLILLIIMVANELKTVQEKDLNIKVGLHALCSFCFLSIVFPIILGFVGYLPFALALSTVGILLYLLTRYLRKRKPDLKTLNREFLIPGYGVLAMVLVCYFLGWMPPVPVSVKTMGIYHKIEKKEGVYHLYHEKSFWKFWQNGDQDFKAIPGDKVYFFLSIYSPARFQDSVYLVWSYKDPKRGWSKSDRLPMTITGGRKMGYRGYAVKENYTPGDWRVSIQTTDSREIGRLYFTISPDEPQGGERNFKLELK